MDNTTLLAKDVFDVDGDEKSALHHVQHTTGVDRFLYAIYTVLGIIFYGIGIFTFLGFIMHIVDGSALLSLGTVVLICYVLLNGLIGYGFMFHRAWLITAFGILSVFMGSMTFFFFTNSLTARGEALLINTLIACGVVCFLLFTKKILIGTFAPPRIMIPFVIALLVSFTLINMSMLN